MNAETAGRVIGVGNLYRGDDAAGLIVARRLKLLFGERVAIVESAGEAAGLLAAWEGARRVLLVDAIRSGAAAGTLFRFDALTEKLPVPPPHRSTHGFGVAEAVELGQTLGRLPESLIVWGVEGRNFDMGDGLSPEVEAALELLVGAVAEELGGVPAASRRGGADPR